MISIAIPCYIDSNDRLENLTLLLNYLKKIELNYPIIVYEYYHEHCKLDLFYNKDIIYKSYPLLSYPFYHKTKLMNLMLEDVHTDFVMFHDTDTFLKKEQYIECYNKMENLGLNWCYPYNGNFVKKDRNGINNFKSSYNIEDIFKLQSSFRDIYSWGGAVCFKTNFFKSIGKWNEEFISWGYEDWEIRDRLIKLGYIENRIEGEMFHLDHEITLNSDFKNKYFRKNEELFNKLKNMSKEELINYYQIV